MPKCRACKKPTTNRFALTYACDVHCAIEFGRMKREARERLELREAKRRIKTRAEWMKEAQAAFNAYIRERDRMESCICCGKWPTTAGKVGGDWDAGHFLSVGSHPELRFDPDNCHKQLKECNAGSGRFSRKGRVVSEGYEAGIVARIGQERVDRLRGPHEPKKYTIEELQEIKQRYTRMRRELVKERI